MIRLKTYIHYGHRHFDSQNTFKQIQNIELAVKPRGGLWGSDINSKFGWIDWVKSNDFFSSKYLSGRWFKFTLKEDARILTISDVKQLKKLPKCKSDILPNPIFVCLDFEKLKKDYDAIEVLLSGNQDLYFALYGWDCDSILVLNDKVVVEVESSDKSKEV